MLLTFLFIKYELNLHIIIGFIDLFFYIQYIVDVVKSLHQGKHIKFCVFD